MAKIQLTDKQWAVLNAAALSCNLNVLPLPRHLNLSPGSAGIVIRGLLQKGVIEKRVAMGSDTVWREEGGTRYALIITKAGLAACVMSPTGEPDENAGNAPQSGPTTAVSESQRRMPRAGSKLAMLVALLEREGGATIEEMAVALGWARHTIRGVMSGALAKRFGFQIASEAVEGRGRAYRIEGAAEIGADEVDGAGE
jgi:hypothetical protein